jgi:hypothetical protein
MNDGGLGVSVALDRTTVNPGDELKVVVTVTNGSTEARVLKFSSGCQTGLEFLENDSDRVAGTPLRMCTAAIGERTLAAGQSFSETHSWVRGAIDGPTLAAGTYKVRGVLLATGQAAKSSGVPVVLR